MKKSVLRIAGETKTLPELIEEVTLSDEAIALLKEAAKDPNGIIIKMYYMGERIVLTNRKAFGGDCLQEKRKWTSALEQLENGGYTIKPALKKEIFEVSPKGYQLANKLSEKE